MNRQLKKVKGFHGEINDQWKWVCMDLMFHPKYVSYVTCGMTWYWDLQETKTKQSCGNHFLWHLGEEIIFKEVWIYFLVVHLFVTLYKSFICFGFLPSAIEMRKADLNDFIVPYNCKFPSKCLGTSLRVEELVALEWQLGCFMGDGPKTMDEGPIPHPLFCWPLYLSDCLQREWDSVN